jgi:hypothetical protein
MAILSRFRFSMLCVEWEPEGPFDEPGAILGI